MPDFEHVCESGNVVRVTLPLRMKSVAAHCAWDEFPPSDADMAEYQRDVLPKIVAAALEKLTCE